MNTRVLVMLSLLVGIGAVLHAIVPPFFLGMRPDMMLAMMFLGIMLFPKLQYVIILSVATGFISALTTTVPGGQLANLIDKPLTALAFFGLYLSLRKLLKKAVAPVLTAVGTIISGTIFLSCVLFVIGLMDASFTVMFATIVLPTAAVNTIVMVVIYPIAQRIMKRTQINPSVPVQP
ncbi:tryptophan transporter [Halobacillus amylolyticus]|uniref:Tryptophan transporter n=1 Tax=Halobacillus amylolyticus TaxID=2932259 RepID=A0ABY4HFZ1_9BACI|nr:tryptophan transporter [Halobacillus amylolyticus]UOR13203.1 tryptophan transporter [Halobacillus amylolyticus]